MPLHAGAEVTKWPLAPDSEYATDWDRLAAAVADNTKLLILCYPNNPLGVALSGNDWQQLERLQESSGIHLLMDERFRDDGLEVLRRWVRGRPELALIEPQGTPFAYLKYDGPVTSADFCRRLLQQKGVLLMPAEVFEDQQAVRLSFGRPPEVLQGGLDRIDASLNASPD